MSDVGRYVVALRQLHKDLCFENGEYDDEGDTAYSAGADALEEVGLIRAHLSALQEQNRALREVLERVMVGGNHLAIHLPENHPPYTAAPEQALSAIGAVVEYDIWCCWRSIMNARDLVAATKQEGGE